MSMVHLLHIFPSITATWAPSQYPKIRLIVRSRKVSKPRDLYLELSDRSGIWQALRQQCCRCACQIAKRYDNLKYQFRGFETLRDLTKKRLFGYWDEALCIYMMNEIKKASWDYPVVCPIIGSKDIQDLWLRISSKTTWFDFNVSNVACSFYGGFDLLQFFTITFAGSRQIPRYVSSLS